MAATPDRDRVRRVRSIFISDLHLGSRRAQATRLVSFLQRHESDFLYLVGDVADSNERDTVEEWPHEHRRVLDLLEEKSSNGTHLVYLPGNHDPGFETVWRARHPELVTRQEDEHVTADGRRLLVRHGHEFDLMSRHVGWLTHLGDLLSGVLERLGPRGERRPHAPGILRLKQSVKRLLGYTGVFRRRALRTARERAFDGIVCGHIHEAALIEQGGVAYHNGGDWVQSCSALVEHTSGRLEIVWDEQAAG